MIETMGETEADTRANRIDPLLRAAGCSVIDGAHFHRQLICPGRILAGGRRGTVADWPTTYSATAAASWR